MDGEAVVMRRKRAVARVCITPVFVYCVRLGMMISGSFFAQTLIENFDFRGAPEFSLRPHRTWPGHSGPIPENYSRG